MPAASESTSGTLELFLAASFLLVGLSHLLQPRRWSEFFSALFRTGCAPFAIAVLTLPFGLFIVLTHNRWAWELPVIVTIYGWGAIAKSTFYLLLPAVAEKVISEKIRRPRHFAIAGAIMMTLGGAVLYGVLARQNPV